MTAVNADRSFVALPHWRPGTRLPVLVDAPAYIAATGASKRSPTPQLHTRAAVIRRLKNNFASASRNCGTLADADSGARDIEGTGIRGFSSRSAWTRETSNVSKLARADKTHLATGLTILPWVASGTRQWTCWPPGLMANLSVTPKRGRQSMRAAERGAWVEFDGISRPASINTCRQAMRERVLHRVWSRMTPAGAHVGEPGGGRFHRSTALRGPALRRRLYGSSDQPVDRPESSGSVAVRVRGVKSIQVSLNHAGFLFSYPPLST